MAAFLNCVEATNLSAAEKEDLIQLYNQLESEGLSEQEAAFKVVSIRRLEIFNDLNALKEALGLEAVPASVAKDQIEALENELKRLYNIREASRVAEGRPKSSTVETSIAAGNAPLSKPLDPAAATPGSPIAKTVPVKPAAPAPAASSSTKSSTPQDGKTPVPKTVKAPTTVSKIKMSANRISPAFTLMLDKGLPYDDIDLFLARQLYNLKPSQDGVLDLSGKTLDEITDLANEARFAVDLNIWDESNYEVDETPGPVKQDDFVKFDGIVYRVNYVGSFLTVPLASGGTTTKFSSTPILTLVTGQKDGYKFKKNIVSGDVVRLKPKAMVAKPLLSAPLDYSTISNMGQLMQEIFENPTDAVKTFPEFADQTRYYFSKVNFVSYTEFINIFDVDTESGTIRREKDSIADALTDNKDGKGFKFILSVNNSKIGIDVKGSEVLYDSIEDVYYIQRDKSDINSRLDIVTYKEYRDEGDHYFLVVPYVRGVYNASIMEQYKTNLEDTSKAKSLDELFYKVLVNSKINLKYNNLTGGLSSFFRGEELDLLLDSHPHLSDLKVSFSVEDSSRQPLGGYYDPLDNRVVVYIYLQELASSKNSSPFSRIIGTAFHELQHAIDRFTPNFVGSSPEAANNDAHRLFKLFDFSEGVKDDMYEMYFIEPVLDAYLKGEDYFYYAVGIDPKFFVVKDGKLYLNEGASVVLPEYFYRNDGGEVMARRSGFNGANRSSQLDPSILYLNSEDNGGLKNFKRSDFNAFFNYMITKQPSEILSNLMPGNVSTSSSLESYRSLSVEVENFLSDRTLVDFANGRGMSSTAVEVKDLPYKGSSLLSILLRAYEAEVKASSYNLSDPYEAEVSAGVYAKRNTLLKHAFDTAESVSVSLDSTKSLSHTLTFKVGESEVSFLGNFDFVSALSLEETSQEANKISTLSQLEEASLKMLGETNTNNSVSQVVSELEKSKPAIEVTLTKNEKDLLKAVYANFSNETNGDPANFDAWAESKVSQQDPTLGAKPSLVAAKEGAENIDKAVGVLADSMKSLFSFEVSVNTDPTAIDSIIESDPVLRQYRRNGIDIPGFYLGGVIYIDKRVATLRTPLHEFGHLFNHVLKYNNRQFYLRGLELIKDTKYYNDVKKLYNYSTEEEYLEEALTWAIEDKGMKIKNRKKEGLFSWLESFWTWVGEQFSLNLTTAEIQNLSLDHYLILASATLQYASGFSKVAAKPASPVSDVYKTEERKERMEVVIPQILAVKEGQSAGFTANLDGSAYEGGGLVIPITSINKNRDELTADEIETFVSSYDSLLINDNLKIGLFAFEDGNTVSIDLNLVVPKKNEAVLLEFARLAGQNSVYDLESKTLVSTGSDGLNPADFSFSELIEIIDSLSSGNLPVSIRRIIDSKTSTARPSLVKNDSEETKNFFSDVVKGKVATFKPLQQWTPEMSLSYPERAFKGTMDQFKGYFDDHIATSIPTFRDMQYKKGSAVVEMLSSNNSFSVDGLEAAMIRDRFIYNKFKSTTPTEEANIPMPIQNVNGNKSSYYRDSNDPVTSELTFEPEVKQDVYENVLLDFYFEPTLLAALQELNSIGRGVNVVGGAVRDALLGTKPKDIDFEVFGVDKEKLMEVLSKYGEVKEQGEAFGVIVLKTSKDSYEFAIPRKDNKTGEGYTGFEVVLNPEFTIEEASKRRDFTWNSISYNPVTNTLYDPNDGISDLKNGIIRHVDPNSFVEDPLRVLRAMQFQARMGHKLAEETKTLIREKAVKEISTISEARFIAEWRKWAVKGKYHSMIFDFLRDTGLDELYPELVSMAGVIQDEYYHPEGDVEEHTKQVLAAARAVADREGLNEKQTEILILSALLHDIAKPETTKQFYSEKKGRVVVTSSGHEAAGAEKARPVLERMGVSKDDTEVIVALIREHLSHANIASIEKQSSKESAFSKLVNRLKPASVEQLMLLMEADMRGRNNFDQGVPATIGEFASLLQDFKNKNAGSLEFSPILKGRHLIAYGMTPGVKFKTILDRAKEAQLNMEFINEPEALEWLATFLKEFEELDPAVVDHINKDLSYKSRYEYLKDKPLSEKVRPFQSPVLSSLAKEGIVDYFDNASTLEDPYVVDSYDAFKKELKEIYSHLLKTNLNLEAPKAKHKFSRFTDLSDVEIDGKALSYGDILEIVDIALNRSVFSNPERGLNTYHRNRQLFSKDAEKALFLETALPEIYRSLDREVPAFIPKQVTQEIINTVNRKPLVYDIGASEGGLVKAITKTSNSTIRSVNIDINEDMKNAFEAMPVEGSEFSLSAFYEDVKLGDKTVKRFIPNEKADVVMETMTFQFITEEREQFIKEIKDSYLLDDGILLIEEKFVTPTQDEYLYNENFKDNNYKAKYYTLTQLNEKREEVLVGMQNNQAREIDFLNTLKSNFEYVAQYWDSGNFKGYAASDDLNKILSFLNSVGNTASIYSNRPLGIVQDILKHTTKVEYFNEHNVKALLDSMVDTGTFESTTANSLKHNAYMVSGLAFHGGPKEIESFDPSFIGKAGLELGYGFYFSRNYYKALDYGNTFTYIDTTNLKLIQGEDKAPAELISALNTLSKVEENANNIVRSLTLKMMADSLESADQFEFGRKNFLDRFRYDQSNFFVSTLNKLGYSGVEIGNGRQIVIYPQADINIVKDPNQFVAKKFARGSEHAPLALRKVMHQIAQDTGIKLQLKPAVVDNENFTTHTSWKISDFVQDNSVKKEVAKVIKAIGHLTNRTPKQVRDDIHVITTKGQVTYEKVDEYIDLVRGQVGSIEHASTFTTFVVMYNSADFKARAEYIKNNFIKGDVHREVMDAILISSRFNAYLDKGPESNMNTSLRAELNLVQKELQEEMRKKEKDADKVYSLKNKLNKLKAEIKNSESFVKFTEEELLNKFITPELETLYNTLSETDDYYINEITDAFIDNSIEYYTQQGEQLTADGWAKVKEDPYYRQMQLNEFKETQKSNMRSILDYLSSSAEYTKAETLVALRSILSYNYDFKNDNIISRTGSTVGNHIYIGPGNLPMIFGYYQNNTENKDARVRFIEAFAEYKKSLPQSGANSGFVTMDIIEKYTVETRPGGWWLKFPQGSDVDDVKALHETAKDVHKRLDNTCHWCTGGNLTTAKTHLEGGDFYIFVDKDMNAKLAMRYRGKSTLQEARGVDAGQGVLGEDLDEQEYFFNNYPGGSAYSDQIKFNKLWNKYKNRKPDEYMTLEEVKTYRSIAEKSDGSYNTKLSEEKRDYLDLLSERSIGKIIKNRDSNSNQILVLTDYINPTYERAEIKITTQDNGKSKVVIKQIGQEEEFNDVEAIVSDASSYRMYIDKIEIDSSSNRIFLYTPSTTVRNVTVNVDKDNPTFEIFDRFDPDKINISSSGEPKKVKFSFLQQDILDNHLIEKNFNNVVLEVSEIVDEVSSVTVKNSTVRFNKLYEHLVKDFYFLLSENNSNNVYLAEELHLDPDYIDEQVLNLRNRYDIKVKKLSFTRGRLRSSTFLDMLEIYKPVEHDYADYVYAFTVDSLPETPEKLEVLKDMLTNSKVSEVEFFLSDQEYEDAKFYSLVSTNDYKGKNKAISIRGKKVSIDLSRIGDKIIELKDGNFYFTGENSNAALIVSPNYGTPDLVNIEFLMPKLNALEIKTLGRPNSVSINLENVKSIYSLTLESALLVSTSTTFKYNNLEINEFVNLGSNSDLKEFIAGGKNLTINTLNTSEFLSYSDLEDFPDSEEGDFNVKKIHFTGSNSIQAAYIANVLNSDRYLPTPETIEALSRILISAEDKSGISFLHELRHIFITGHRLTGPFSAEYFDIERDESSVEDLGRVAEFKDQYGAGLVYKILGLLPDAKLLKSRRRLQGYLDYLTQNHLDGAGKALVLEDYYIDMSEEYSAKVRRNVLFKDQEIIPYIKGERFELTSEDKPFLNFEC